MPVNLCEKYPLYYSDNPQRIIVSMSHERRTNPLPQEPPKDA